MGKRIQTGQSASFAPRLAELRKAAGFTQVELAAELGSSQRIAAHDESPAATPPAVATTLSLSIDELFVERDQLKRKAPAAVR